MTASQSYGICSLTSIPPRPQKAVRSRQACTPLKRPARPHQALRGAIPAVPAKAGHLDRGRGGVPSARRGVLSPSPACAPAPGHPGGPSEPLAGPPLRPREVSRAVGVLSASRAPVASHRVDTQPTAEYWIKSQHVGGPGRVESRRTAASARGMAGSRADPRRAVDPQVHELARTRGGPGLRGPTPVRPGRGPMHGTDLAPERPQHGAGRSAARGRPNGGAGVVVPLRTLIRSHSV